MALDERRYVRELALRRILKSRSLPSKQKTKVRSFIVPTLKFDAQEYFNIIDWSSAKLSSPPLLSNVSNEHISHLIESGFVSEWDIRDFPSHTQSVERCVKLVSESAQKVLGFENRDGFIRSTLKSRGLMRKFETKVQFPVDG